MIWYLRNNDLFFDTSKICLAKARTEDIEVKPRQASIEVVFTLYFGHDIWDIYITHEETLTRFDDSEVRKLLTARAEDTRDKVMKALILSMDDGGYMEGDDIQAVAEDYLEDRIF